MDYVITRQFKRFAYGHNTRSLKSAITRARKQGYTRIHYVRYLDYLDMWVIDLARTSTNQTP